jgi:5-methyltetrahydropteroyltriglutamate--homocysteine methyltransferase
LTRILTTHVGSLPRPADLVDLLRAHDRDEPHDAAKLEEVITRSVADIVAAQEEADVDIVNDGESSKISYSTYIRERLSGYGETDKAQFPSERRREHDDFPEYYGAKVRPNQSRRRFACTGPVAMKDFVSVKRDIADLKKAVQGRSVQAFMTAASPGVIASFQPNLFYPSQAEYLEAVAEAMRAEYEAIVEAGFFLQLDCPDLTTIRYEQSQEDFLKSIGKSVDAMNHALRNVPATKVRMHLCWGNYQGPHTHDTPLELILPDVLRAKPHAILLEGANPRHAHEWEIWTRVKLPEGKVLVPGVLDTTTNFVEHPELVAQRLTSYAKAVGPERVIASTDCGFETMAGHGQVERRIVFAKLKAMAEGAAIASKRL